MAKYKVTGGVATFGAGHIFKPTDEQLAARQHCLAAIAGRKGWYEPTQHVYFKDGEVLEFSGDMPKGIDHLLEKSGGKASSAARANDDAAGQRQDDEGDATGDTAEGAFLAGAADSGEPAEADAS